MSWMPVAHACNPGYSGGRDQDWGSKPAGQIVCDTLSRKKTYKKGLVVQGVGSEFKPQYWGGKKKPSVDGHSTQQYEKLQQI
jgi:hypothetical protein